MVPVQSISRNDQECCGENRSILFINVSTLVLIYSVRLSKVTMESDLNTAELSVRKAIAKAERAKERANVLAKKADLATKRLQLLQTKEEKEIELQYVVDQLKSLEEPAKPTAISMRLTVKRISTKPVLALPRLLLDHSDVDPAFRDHLKPQTEQIIQIFKALSSPEKPLVKSMAIKKYIEENYLIENPDYWKSKTHPREPVRWWKAVYDKAIERLDLKLNLIARSDYTGKKGLYALREYLPEQMPLFV